MAVYVDDMRASLGRMVMCHMIADTTEELLAMADRIGVSRRYIQHAGTSKEHFDVTLGRRSLAVAFGAVEVDRRRLGAMLRERDGYCPCKDCPHPNRPHTCYKDGCESYTSR